MLLFDMGDVIHLINIKMIVITPPGKVSSGSSGFPKKAMQR